MRVTKTLLACGVVAGPRYVLVSLTEALTRDGFDLARHQWSLLSNGDLGWIHIANLVVTGLVTVAFAVGLRHALRPGRGGTWAARGGSVGTAEKRVPFELPAPAELADRLSSVLEVIYLIFNQAIGRPPATTGCGRRSARTRFASAGSWPA
jgi:uncharacterized protein DUF998